MCGCIGVQIIEGRFEGPSMGRALRRISGLEALGRGVALAVVALGTAGCAAIQNAMPDPGLFHLPDRSTFFPTGVSSYTRPVSASGPVGPADLVDGQGRCAGQPSMAGSSGRPPVGSRGVSLEMTECEVVRALGQPQSAEFGAQSGERTAVLTYVTGERAGIYRFSGGRLLSIERGAEPLPPPPVAKKPPPRKPKPQQGAGSTEKLAPKGISSV
jgi:hypothetical protein